MKHLLTLALAFIIIPFSFAQVSETDSLSKAKISALAFMTGDWHGTGWMMGQQGKSEFEQTENIQFKLDSTIILIEGKGMANDVVVHNALAVISYDKEKDHYTFLSYLQNGQKGEFKAELIENKLYWYPNEMVRYIIWLNEDGNWYEKGEYNQGDNWFQFFEMTLSQR